MHEWMNGWLHEWMNGWLNEWMNGWLNGWMNGWLNEWMNGWLNEWMKLLANWSTFIEGEGVLAFIGGSELMRSTYGVFLIKVCALTPICECLINEWMHEWMHGWMNGWLHEWMNGWLNEWMNGWLNGWMNGWLNEWMNGWLNEWMKLLANWSTFIEGEGVLAFIGGSELMRSTYGVFLIKVCALTPICECLINEWMHEWMHGWMNAWMN